MISCNVNLTGRPISRPPGEIVWWLYIIIIIIIIIATSSQKNILTLNHVILYLSYMYIHIYIVVYVRIMKQYLKNKIHEPRIED